MSPFRRPPTNERTAFESTCAVRCALRTEFDKLEDYALALSHAHSLWKATTAPKVDLAEQAAALSAARDDLLIAARALARRGLIDGAPLEEVKTQVGYRPIAGDIVTMVSLVQSRWSAAEGKTALTLAELNELGARANAYENARRAVAYVREEEGDAEQIAPSIFGGRRKRGENNDAETTVISDGESSTRPKSADVAAKATPEADGPPPAFKIDNALNFPITNPFTS